MGGDVRGAAAVAVGSLGSLDVEVQQFHLSEHKMNKVLKICCDSKNNLNTHSQLAHSVVRIQRWITHVL